MSAVKVDEYKNNLSSASCLAKTGSKVHSLLDNLSHELRTPLHAISGYTDFLQAAPNLLLRVIRKLPTMPWKSLKKRLSKTSALLKDNLAAVQANLLSLETFVSEGKYQAFSHELKAIGESATSPLEEFVAKQRDIAQCYATLSEAQKLLDALIAVDQVLDKENLVSQLQAVANKLKIHLNKAKAAADQLNNLIPVSWGQLTSDTDTVSQVNTSSTKLLNALVVDDNIINRQLLGKHLKREGFKCDFAENGAQAVEKFSPEKYAIVFMDMMMPVMDGYNATKAIRTIEKTQRCKSTPIVAVTAIVPSLENKAQVAAAGMDDFISKPFSATQIKRLIKRHVLNQATSPDSSDSDEGLSPLPLILPTSTFISSRETSPVKIPSPATLVASFGFSARRSISPMCSSAATTPVAAPQEPVASSPRTASLLGAIGCMSHRASLSTVPTLPDLSVDTASLSIVPTLSSMAK